MVTILDGRAMKMRLPVLVFKIHHLFFSIVKLNTVPVKSVFYHAQSLLNGPHTRVRVDPLLAPGTSIRASGSNGKGRGGAAQQRGLGQF